MNRVLGPHITFLLLVLNITWLAVNPHPHYAQAQMSGDPQTQGRAAFVHPGLLHTEADFDRMRAKVKAQQQPWLAGWQKLTESKHAQLNWNPRPTGKVIRGGSGQNFPVLFNDVHAAYQLALRWKISGDTAYADKSIDIMNRWSANLKEVAGNADRFLAAGIYGYQFANAAEIMRTYPGWDKADFERFQQMMLDVFYVKNEDFLFGNDSRKDHNGAAITNYWANWDLANLASMQAIGVLCDRRDIYDRAMDYVYHGRGNGAIDKAIYFVHPGNLGQWQEAGRDQGHTTLGIALMGPICETAWNQGDDLYAFDNNRFLAGAEYVAKYNLGEEVPYQLYAWGIGPRGDHREQPVISDGGRPAMRYGYELVVNHYVNRIGIAAPWSTRYAEKLRPEGGGGGHASTFDQFGFGTLTHSREPQINDPLPTGITIRKNGDALSLSWWGAAHADAYRIERANDPAGPFEVIATNIKEPLTFTDKDLPHGTYYYVITLMGDNWRPRRSPPIKATVGATLHTHIGFEQSRGIPRDDDVIYQHTLKGGAERTKGIVRNAVKLDGKDGYVELPQGIVSNLSDFTIATWVYLNADQTWARIFDFGNDRGQYMFLTPRSNDGKLRFCVSTIYGYNRQVIDAPTALPIGRWVHVAVTLAGREGTLYVDGRRIGHNSQIDFPPFRLGQTSRNWIGRSQHPNDPYLNAIVDEFRIYDGALTAEQIADLAETDNR